MAESAVGCQHEGDIVDAIATGRWPSAVEPELREHTRECATCREVADIASVLRDDQMALRRAAVLPSARQMWWRAAVRAKVDAQRSAARPIIIVQRVAAVAAAAAMAAAPMWIAARTDWRGIATTAAARGTEIASGLAGNATLSVVLAFTACALFAPVVLYLLLADD